MEDFKAIERGSHIFHGLNLQALEHEPVEEWLVDNGWHLSEVPVPTSLIDRSVHYQKGASVLLIIRDRSQEYLYVSRLIQDIKQIAGVEGRNAIYILAEMGYDEAALTRDEDRDEDLDRLLG
jgi:hypothetical protein